MNTTRQLYCDARAPRVKFLPRMSHTTDPLGESEAHEQLLGMFASELLTSVPRRAVELARRLLKADAAGLQDTSRKRASPYVLYCPRSFPLVSFASSAPGAS